MTTPLTPAIDYLLRVLAARETSPRAEWRRLPDAVMCAIRHAVDAGLAAWQGDRLRITLAGAAALGAATDG